MNKNIVRIKQQEEVEYPLIYEDETITNTYIFDLNIQVVSSLQREIYDLKRRLLALEKKKGFYDTILKEWDNEEDEKWDKLPTV